MHENQESTTIWPEIITKSAKHDPLLQYICSEALLQTLLHIVALEWGSSPSSVLSVIAAVSHITDFAYQVITAD